MHNFLLVIMQRIHRQGSIAGGILLLVLGTILLGLFIFLIVLIIDMQSLTSNNDGWMYDSSYNYHRDFRVLKFGLGLFLGGIGSIACFIGGILMIKSGIRGNEVRKNGVKAVCTVENVETIWYRRGSRHYEIDFSYKGQSGERHNLHVSVSVYRIDKPKEGEKYECMVYEEDCYIDIDNLTLVKEDQFE